MAIQLSQDDFDRLTGILRQMPEFRTADRRARATCGKLCITEQLQFDYLSHMG
jgi:hypothetical protein